MTEHYRCIFVLNINLGTKRIFDLPMNAGLTDHTVIGPCDANWPNDSSKKNKGIPAIHNIMAYGIRKAPAMNIKY